MRFVEVGEQAEAELVGVIVVSITDQDLDGATRLVD
jgi:hypothetical protein